MGRFKGTKGMILLAIIVVLIVGYYFYLSNMPSEKESVEDVTISAVQGVLLRDLEKNYPPTPKEVVKYYSEITQCFYNGDISDEDILLLGAKANELYDTELKNNKTEEQYEFDLKADIIEFAEKNIKISSFSTSPSTDVEYYTKDGFDFAKLYCVYSIRQGTSMSSTSMTFLLRKDEQKHWKIFGWELTK